MCILFGCKEIMSVEQITQVMIVEETEILYGKYIEL